jgi:hypothetical protein
MRRAHKHRLREHVVRSGAGSLATAVDDTLLTACLDRVLTQVEVTFSSSMIEAFWRSLKHQWLYLNSLDSIERLRALVEFCVEQHNTQTPHAAFSGQTPDETYFGTTANLSAELAAARTRARVARLAANRAMSCGRCRGSDSCAGRASRRQPSDVLRPLPRLAPRPNRIANSSMIPALTLLRTRAYGTSLYAAVQVEPARADCQVADDLLAYAAFEGDAQPLHASVEGLPGEAHLGRSS